jgi:hypothetical protein
LNGYFLGNPVTGQYTFTNDCRLTFQLQDISGGFQHFQGLARPGGNFAEIHQTDPGAGGRGVMERASSDCSATSVHGPFALTLSGTASQFNGDQDPGSRFSLSGTIEPDGGGNLTLTTTAGKTPGSYQVDSDCVVEMELAIPTGDSLVPLKLRGVLAARGKLILAVESDPGHVATARLTAKP